MFKIDGQRGAHSWVEVDEDRTGNVFAIAGLGEEAFVGANFTKISSIWIFTSVRLETVLEQIPVVRL